MRVPLPPAFLSIPLAHRGYHDHSKGVIENSLSAFRAAITAGYGIELDVQRSADDVAVVFHDDELDRLTAATGAFRDHSAATLGRTALRGSTASTRMVPGSFRSWPGTSGNTVR